MPSLKYQIPKYRKHRASGQAIVTLSGCDFYLGPHGTKASKLEYDRLIQEWLASARQLKPDDDKPELTVVEVCAAYKRYARTYYRKNGKVTREFEMQTEALLVVCAAYGRKPASSFKSLALQAVQGMMVEKGWSRGYINKQIGRIVRAFRWLESQELVPAGTHQSLKTVRGLQKGRTEARETDPVEPVDEKTVQATLAELPEVVADMVRFQRLTGCRPGEVCNIRPSDVQRDGDVWLYLPFTHKTEQTGRPRVVCIGPRAQAVLRPYLLRDGDSFCFSPLDSERRRRAEMHAHRRTPMSCGNRPGTNCKLSRRRPAGACYTADSYRRAIHRACDNASVDRWSPNRLRHSAATDIRKQYGLEAAQVVLGHSQADVTQVYAERDLKLAARIAREVG